jgi:hypothetical protein
MQTVAGVAVRRLVEVEAKRVSPLQEMGGSAKPATFHISASIKRAQFECPNSACSLIRFVLSRALSSS